MRQFTVTASGQSVAYKEEVKAGVNGLAPLPPGPVELELSYVVGSQRNWMNLWKPTIDSLGVLLGHTTETRDWHPLDGRIVRLGLHCAVDPTAGNEIAIAVVAKAVTGYVRAAATSPSRKGHCGDGCTSPRRR